jgi:hypothetical protein
VQDMECSVLSAEAVAADRTDNLKCVGRALSHSLDGMLQFAREDERTIVRCSVPIRRDADVRGT